MITTPEHEKFHTMADHDLLVEIAVKTEKLEKHSEKQNGDILNLMTAQLKVEGALLFGRWVLGITLAALTITAMVAVRLYG